MNTQTVTTNGLHFTKLADETWAISGPIAEVQAAVAAGKCTIVKVQHVNVDPMSLVIDAAEGTATVRKAAVVKKADLAAQNAQLLAELAAFKLAAANDPQLAQLVTVPAAQPASQPAAQPAKRSSGIVRAQRK